MTEIKALTAEEHARAIVNLIIQELNPPTPDPSLSAEEKGETIYNNCVYTIEGYIKMVKLFKLDE